MLCIVKSLLSRISIHCVVLFTSAFLVLSVSQTVLSGQTVPGSFKFEGRTRDYLVFLPQNFEPNMPVVFVLHGATENAAYIKNYTGMNSVADTAGFIAVYPNAVSPRFVFNDGATNRPDVDDVGFISALIDMLEAQYDIDLARVYSCGYSNGGMMTYRLLCQLGHRFAAGASVAGTLNDHIASGSSPIRPFPLLQIHGTADNRVPYNGNGPNWSVEETLNFWLENNACLSEPNTLYLPDLDAEDNSTVEKISYLNCDDETNIILYKIINGGHHWPGGETWWTGGGNLNMDLEKWKWTNRTRT